MEKKGFPKRPNMEEKFFPKRPPSPTRCHIPEDRNLGSNAEYVTITSFYIFLYMYWCICARICKRLCFLIDPVEVVNWADFSTILSVYHTS